MLTEKEINDRFEENRKLLGNFPLAINLIRYKEVFNQATLAISLQAEIDRLKADTRPAELSRLDELQQMRDALQINWWPEGDSDREILRVLVCVVTDLVEHEIKKEDSSWIVTKLSIPD